MPLFDTSLSQLGTYFLLELELLLHSKMPSLFESSCRILLLAIFLQYPHYPTHSSLLLAISLEACITSALLMAFRLRQLTTTRFAPVAAFPPTVQQAARPSHSEATQAGLPIMSVWSPSDKSTFKPFKKVVRTQQGTYHSVMPKSREHQDILRKKRQKDAATQTESVQETSFEAKYAELQKEYAESLIKSALESTRAQDWKQKYEDSIKAAQASDERAVTAETAFQELKTNFNIEWEAVIESCNEANIAWQNEHQEFESLRSAHEKLKRQHQTLVENIRIQSQWRRQLLEDAQEWSQIKEKQLILLQEPTTSNETVNEQHEWRNDSQDSEMETPSLSGSLSSASSQIHSSPSTPFSSPEISEPEIAQYVVGGVQASLDHRSHQMNETTQEPSKLHWNREFVPADYFEENMANDSEDYPDVASWMTHGSICVEVGSSKDDQPLYFRLVPQVASPEAGRIVPCLLSECHKLLLQYMSNNIAILAGVSVSSSTAADLRPLQQEEAKPPLWRRRNRDAMPKVKLGLALKEDRNRAELPQSEPKTSFNLEDPFDDCYAIEDD